MSDEMKKVTPGEPEPDALERENQPADQPAFDPTAPDRPDAPASAPQDNGADHTRKAPQQEPAAPPSPAVPTTADSGPAASSAKQVETGPGGQEAVSAFAADKHFPPREKHKAQKPPFTQAPTSATPAQNEKVKQAQEKQAEQDKDKSQPGGSTFLSALKLGGILFLVAAIMAVMLASVNEVTKGPIADHERQTLETMISAMFPESTGFKQAQVPAQYEKDVAAIYEIQSKNGGVCIHATPTGFGGTIDLLVGFNPDGSISSVKVLAMSETAGIGTKTEDESFLGQYLGKSGPIEIGGSSEQSITAISGATISSKAVTLGVNNAIGVYQDLYGTPAGTAVTPSGEKTPAGEETAAGENGPDSGNTADAAAGPAETTDAANSDTQDGGNE